MGLVWAKTNGGGWCGNLPLSFEGEGEKEVNMTKRKLQSGDIVKVIHDEIGELQDCVGTVVKVDKYDETVYIAVAFGEVEAANTTLLSHNEEPEVWGAWFERQDLRYSPKLNPSPIRCVPE